MPEYKQVILVRIDLKMSKGKTAAQCAHASLDSCLRVMQQDRILKTKIFDNWHKQGAKKIVVKVADESALFKYKSDAERAGIKVAVVKDAGHTELPPGTYTTLGVGPDVVPKIDQVVGKLPML